MRTFNALLIVAIAVMITAAAWADNQPAARVVAQSGDAWAEANGARRALAMRANIFEGDVIITGANGRVQVMFKDQTLFTLGPNSRVGVREYMRNNAMRAEFQLQQGRIRMISGQIVRQNPDNFRMTTPTASIGIRGTMTGHEIEGGSEKHYVLDIAEGHNVIISGINNPGDYRVLTGDYSAVDIGADGSVGEVREMSAEEINVINEATTIPAGSEMTVATEATSENGAAASDGTTTTATNPDGSTTTTTTNADGSITTTVVAADGTTTTTTTGGLSFDGAVAPDGTAPAADATLTVATTSLSSDATTTYVASNSDQVTQTVITEITATPASTYTHGIGSTILVGSSGAPAATYRQMQVQALGSSATFDQQGGLGAMAATLDASDNPTVTAINYNSSVWSGAQAATYSVAGEYTSGGTPYMEWGSWDMGSPNSYNLAGGSNPGVYSLSRGYGVMGQLTPSADLAALRSNNVSAHYAGAASGTYYLNSNAAQTLSGSFGTDINFGTNEISNVNISFASPGITLSTSGHAGLLNANGTFEITSPLSVTSPGIGTHSGSITGAAYGSSAAAVGGVWEMSTVGSDNERATGEFHGVR